MKRYAAGLVLIMTVLSATSQTPSAAEPGGNAMVIALIGTADVYDRRTPNGRPLSQGDRLQADQEVRAGEKSRLAIRFPDGTVMRLAEKARLKMNELTFNAEKSGKNVKVELLIGKLWAKVKKISTPGSSVEVKTSNAVAGVRGTVYRINVEDDQSAMIKVYDGSVYVANPPRDSSRPVDKVVQPHQVAGPHEISPPAHPVSMEEWTVIVKEMQQLSISSKGVVSKPENFDPKTDADDWVVWNRELDKETTF